MRGANEGSESQHDHFRRQGKLSRSVAWWVCGTAAILLRCRRPADSGRASPLTMFANGPKLCHVKQHFAYGESMMRVLARVNLRRCRSVGGHALAQTYFLTSRDLWSVAREIE